MLKKSILSLVAVLLLSFSLNAQFLDFRQNNERGFLGVQLGQAGSGTDYHDFGFGVSMSVYGLYVDFLLAPPEYTDDNHLINELWDDDEAYTINFGYQIPILPWLRVAPIIGYSQCNYGYTDIGTLNQHIEEDGDISNSHDYVVEKRFHELNYGGALFVELFGNIELYGVYTRRAIYGGISLNLNWNGWLY